MAKYKDDEFDVITNDIERLRAKPHMYISYTGPRGALHLTKEVINNAIDESVSIKSPCKRIEATLDENSNQITVSDDGRGIPFEMVSDICTYLQSGSNLHKEETVTDKDGRKAGENGVGLTAVNALSDKLLFIIYRDGKRGVFTFEDGKLADEKYTNVSADKHGTSVIFIPSEKYLKKCKIDATNLRNWINEISYMLNAGTSFTFNLIKKGKEVAITEKFKHKNGIVDLLTENVKSPVSKPIHVSHKFNGDSIEVAYGMSNEDMTDFTNVKSFCNWVTTVDHGEHVNAAKMAWCRVVSKITTEQMSASELKKYPITFEDCRLGLGAVVVLFCLEPHFSGQTKEKVGNYDLFAPINRALYSELYKYFRDNPTEAKKIANFVKKNAKTRLEVSKIKKSDYKRMDSFEEAVLKGYSPALNSEGYAELLIVEGDSAKDGVTGVCDYRTQAVFKIKGNPKNVYGCTIAQVLENAELKVLTKIIGAGIGKEFDLKKCKFDRIIIFPDSDIDSWNITSLLCTYFLCTMPALVQAGKVFRALAPLYIIDDKKNPYLLSKVEYFELFANKVVDKMSLTDTLGNTLSNAQLRNLITENKDYLSELIPLAKYFYTNPEIIEFALVCGKKPNFGKVLKKKFPLLDYNDEDKIVQGDYNGTYQYIILSDSFFDKCKRLYNLIHETNHGNIYYTIEDEGKRIDGIQSLGNFFEMNKKYLPTVVDRIKGLGELPGDVLWNTTLDPRKRSLVRLTCADLERELDTVKILHGPEPELRKKFMQGYVFNKEDIDN